MGIPMLEFPTIDTLDDQNKFKYFEPSELGFVNHVTLQRARLKAKLSLAKKWSNL